MTERAGVLRHQPSWNLVSGILTVSSRIVEAVPNIEYLGTSRVGIGARQWRGGKASLGF